MADEKYSKAPSNQKQMERIEPAPSVVEGILDLASENFSLRGADCAKMLEHVPQFIKAPCELVMKNKNNAWIVLGRDRPNTLLFIQILKPTLQGSISVRGPMWIGILLYQSGAIAWAWLKSVQLLP